jgi:hypothetical protein
MSQPMDGSSWRAISSATGTVVLRKNRGTSTSTSSVSVKL